MLNLVQWGRLADATPFVAISALLTLTACGGSGNKKVEPPPAPTGLEAVAGDGQVALTWNVAEGATGYRVLRASVGEPRTLTASPTGTSHTDRGLTNGTSYTYVVQAVNKAGQSPISMEVSATPAAPLSVPAAPANLTATPGDSQVTLSWDASARATSYEIWRDTGCTGTFAPVATPTQTWYTDTGLANGTPYCYTVKARNGAGTSLPSSQVSATPHGSPSSAPPAPTGLTATPGDAQVTLDWTDSAGATGYIVERAAAPGGPYVQAGTPSGTAFTDASLGNGKRYYYVVRATNAAGSSPASAEVSALPLSGREICVTNENAHTMAVFDLTSSGSVPPLRRLGNLTGTDTLQAVAFDRVNGEIYVANVASHPYSPAYPVVVYAQTADGNVAPIRSISGPNTGLRGAFGLAVDPVNNELFVSWDGAIRVFPRTANGDVPPIRKLDLCLGCAPGIAVAPTPRELFVPSGNSIVVYGRTAQGSATPLRTIAGSFTELSNPTSVAFDAVHDEIVVASSTRIGIFPRTASGNTFPTRTIYADFPANLTGITFAAVDDDSGDIYVASTTSVAVFPRTADQGVMPSRTLSGSHTGFSRPFGIAVSPASGELFVGDNSTRRLVIHALAASGNVAPLRTISGVASGVEHPTGVAAAPGTGRIFVTNNTVPSVTSYATPWTGTPEPATSLRGGATALASPGAIAVDESNSELYVANSSSNSITVYALGADGNVAPVRTLAGNLTGLSGPGALAVDVTNDELFVGNNSKTITVYTRTASGNAAPVRTLGTSIFLGSPAGFRVDTANGELVVASLDGTTSEILVFARTASGTAAPLRKIRGPATLLARALDVAVDPVRDELLVTNADGPSITVYSRTAEGNVAPLRTLSGAETLLSQPSGVTVCQE